VRPALVTLLLALALLAPAARADTLEEGAEMTTFAEGLQRPVALAFGPDGALYYAELDGGLRVIRPGASAPEAEPLWTPPNLQTGGERGFVGLALDPDFASTRAFYVFYTHNASGTITNRVSKVVDGEETEILWGLRAGLLHNSGRLAFMPDKTLLVSAGDTILDTAGPHLARHAHDEKDLAGKVLRVNRDGSVPADNPFGNEVWTKGHRNVFGLAVSPEGVVIGTENGPEKSDEVNLLAAGNDYGWPTCKGACDDEDPAEARGQYTDPVLEYESTISPTGATWHAGYFYFSDFNKGRIHRIYELPNGSWADDRVVRLDQPRILDITTGPGGLYFSTWDSVHKVTLDERWTSGGPAPTTPPTPDPDESPTGATPTPGEGGGHGDPTPDTIEGDAGTPGPALWLVCAATLVALLVRRRPV
jgi:glucose/arabinose dehydrogenase